MSEFLKSIDSPEDLKKLSLEELPELAKEIRQMILEVVSQKGGHLSSSLGAVDLAIALHYVFNSPVDKIIWDVGHQIYAHKIITGRRDRFSTLREFGGLSGFSKPEESPHDPVITGHSSNSISAALGLAVAGDYDDSDSHVVAVIGDGAFTGGMAFEALNHAGSLGKDMLVILNANEMSISRNVGAMSEYFNRIISGHFYNRMKNDLEQIVEKIPGFGHKVVESAHKLEESIKSLIVPGVLFEEMGFRYFGPVNGHDLPNLTRMLKSLKDIQGPKLLHVITTKGKGYSFAEERPDLYHSASPFDLSTGKSTRSDPGKSFSSVFGDALVELAKNDEKIIAITAAMTQGTGLSKFAELFPDRFYDVGIAEQHAVTFAAGLAIKGLKPVVAIYSTFLQRALDQIMHDVCLMKLPIVFAVDRAGLVGPDGPTHHGIFDVSFLKSLPGLVVSQPRDIQQLRDMLAMAVNCDSPTVIRFPKRSDEISLSTEFNPVQPGKWEIIKKGTDGWFVVTGPTVETGLACSELLAKDSFDFGVVDARFLKPLDSAFVTGAAAEGKPMVVIEENPVYSGLGEAVSGIVTKSPYQVKVLSLGLPDRIVPHGNRQSLLDFCDLSVNKVSKRVKEWLKSLGKS